MIEQRVTLRYDAQQIPAIVQAVQGDTGRDVIFELADYEIPAGATANYYIDKPDDTAVYNSAEVISSTEILAHLTEQALAAPGRNNGQVRILSDGEVITSFDFVLEVAAFRGILHMQSETEINIFDQAIEDAVNTATEEAVAEIQAQTPVVTGMQNSIAPTYNASSTYAVGDYVMYNAQLYRCITAITTAEAWTAAHWMQIPLADDVHNLKDKIYEIQKQQNGKVIGSVIFDNLDHYYTAPDTIADSPNHFKCTEMLIPSNLESFEVTFGTALPSSFKVIMILDKDKNLLTQQVGGSANTTYTVAIDNFPTAVYAQINYFNDVYYDAIKIHYELSSSEEDIKQIKYALSKSGDVVDCDFIYGKFVNYTGVIQNVDSKWGISSPIHLNQYDKIYVKCSSYADQVSIVTKCDEFGENLVPKVRSAGSDLQEYSYIASADEYVIVTILFASEWNICTTNTIQNSGGDNWENVRWLMVGDSLTEKNVRAVTSYFEYIASETGIQTINKGRSGQGYMRGTWFFNAITPVGADNFDICTFFGSGNDMYHEVEGELVLYTEEEWADVLGNINDTGFNTICGCINETFNHFIDLYPLKKFGVITPTPWIEFYDISIDSLAGSMMDDYSNVIIKICENRGVPCLDLFHKSGLRPWNSDFRTEYYTENGLADRGVHPNSKGHKWMHKIIEQFLKQFLVD